MSNYLSLKEYENTIFCDDCLNKLKELPDNSIDLIVTSPPYADNRKNTYGGVKTTEYVEWLWTEEFCWHKKNSVPGKWKNRFRDAWERCLQFNKQKDFAMYQDEVKVPIGDWAKTRLKNLSDNDKTRTNAKNNSGFGKNISNWVGKETVYPSNVLYLATECSNKGHSAAFPEELPTWFIKLFTQEGDIVLDPFVGSGTTAVAAKKLNRKYIGIDKEQDYCNLALENIAKE